VVASQAPYLIFHYDMSSKLSPSFPALEWLKSALVVWAVTLDHATLPGTWMGGKTGPVGFHEGFSLRIPSPEFTYIGNI
jgi:hypothetical protein